MRQGKGVATHGEPSLFFRSSFPSSLFVSLLDSCPLMFMLRVLAPPVRMRRFAPAGRLATPGAGARRGAARRATCTS